MTDMEKGLEGKSERFTRDYIAALSSCRQELGVLQGAMPEPPPYGLISFFLCLSIIACVASYTLIRVLPVKYQSDEAQALSRVVHK
jgi:hypothetical protein